MVSRIFSQIVNTIWSCTCRIPENFLKVSFEENTRKQIVSQKLWREYKETNSFTIKLKYKETALFVSEIGAIFLKQTKIAASFDKISSISDTWLQIYCHLHHYHVWYCHLHHYQVIHSHFTRETFLLSLPVLGHNYISLLIVRWILLKSLQNFFVLSSRILHVLELRNEFFSRCFNAQAKVI